MTVHHVALEVLPEDAAAEVEFWALLSFEEVEPPTTLRQRARWLQRAGTQVHVMYANDPVVPTTGHTAVIADDYEATLERLRGAGIDVDERAQHWGAPRCVVHTPAGHRVEIMAAPPG